VNTWDLKLTVTEDGTVNISSASPGVPPGEIEVAGLDDGNRISLEARQRDPHGRFVIAAYHNRFRAEEALRDAEQSPEDRARAGYERYRAHAGGISKFTGTPLPAYDDQDPDIRAHWIAAFTG
jgi:hypothetical protein